MDLDSLDNFEFKPLTEGLGFHKKAQDVRSSKSEAARPQAATRASDPDQQERALSRASIMDTPATRASSLGFDDEDESPSLSSPHSSSLSSSAGSASKSISDLIASLPPSLDFTESKTEDPLELSTPRPQIFQPLAREDYKPSFAKPKFEAPRFEVSKTDIRPAPTLGQVLPPPGTKATASPSATVAAPLAPSGGASKPLPAPPSPYRASMNESLARAFPHAVARAPETAANVDKKKAAPVLEAGLEPVAANLGSGILDAMVVTGISTVLLVIILAITKANLWGLLSNAQTDGPTQFHLLLLFLAVLQLYMLTARSFFGATLGEWAFDLQLGTNQEQVAALYPLKVVWRTLLITFTGIVLLPLASMISGRDLARYVTGLQLYRRP